MSVGPSILGVDPGPERTAFTAFDGVGVPWAQYGHADLILDSPVRDGDWVVVIEFPQARAIKPRRGHNGSLIPQVVGAEVHDTCRIAGRLEQWCHEYGIDVYGVYPATHYTHLTGIPNPKSGIVTACLESKIGPYGSKDEPGPLKRVYGYGVTGGAHLRDALSVAWAFYDGPRGEWQHKKPKPVMWKWGA